MRARWLTYTALLVFILPSAHAFYVTPGFAAPEAHQDGEMLTLWLNKLSSERSLLNFALAELPFVCKPRDPKPRLLNLGEVLRGDRIVNSDYEISMNVKSSCSVLCSLELTAEQSQQAAALVKEEYDVELILDNLPAATVMIDADDKRVYEDGFRLGLPLKGGGAAIHNHLTFKLLYNTVGAPANHKYIVGFEVYPKSIKNSANKCPSRLDGGELQLLTGEKQTITFTYSVDWEEEKHVEWSTRWDMYLVQGSTQIHWYSIINSMIILLFLSAMVAIILLRTLRRDIAIYNDEELKEEQEDTTGWKLVHGDVFRPPRYGGLLAPLLGSGIQFALMIYSTTLLALVGILNPSYRGGLVSFALFLFVFMGTFAGYYSARMYKVFRGTAWGRNAIMTALFFPAILFTILFVVNGFIWSQQSSNALPFGTFAALVAMWFGISLPLVYIGAYFGQKKSPIEHPIRTNQIPRQIPDVPWYLRGINSVLLGGLMPFGVIFIEMWFILRSAWTDSYYYMFGFFALVLLILLITVIEVSVSLIYFVLCAEDYHWWWRSFFIGGSAGIYIFLYSIFYYATKLHISDPVSTLIYFTHSLIVALVFLVSFGSVGFFSTYVFLIQVYGSVKVSALC
ncbi:endosomal protein [Gonapodya prolifera JEL478]|uniref:Transmembrane 9 superfamily member n=1 Tax=Gonapodya prolifera (strain JEL478) TaxID=1344416 RepID=A0A139AK02_GONPJ|nr:endosomal protein [Gonapodya prolifera JEL478]|eukprot:KXS17099.1 endosomal protein [Gonapodya prolifera JEL478]